jgi:hypothetical protein
LVATRRIIRWLELHHLLSQGYDVRSAATLTLSNFAGLEIVDDDLRSALGASKVRGHGSSESPMGLLETRPMMFFALPQSSLHIPDLLFRQSVQLIHQLIN